MNRASLQARIADVGAEVAALPGMPKIRVRRVLRAWHDAMVDVDSLIDLVLSPAPKPVVRAAARRLRKKLSGPP